MFVYFTPRVVRRREFTVQAEVADCAFVFVAINKLNGRLLHGVPEVSKELYTTRLDFVISPSQ